ncbi:response regulator [Ideonella azotifigens]|uniref:Response regulator n=1 Tax=Ideonella azotifigens TaxID=513160 RepID=A0ABP3UUR4_9BURK|nr:response regulator [Ideonella azotifigens]MCD2339811.1 response regulator [Ideonella azotifigens]
MTTLHVIDDDERSRKLASDVLAAAGFEVLQSGTAAAARDQLSAHGADLVLLDIQLPDEDGFKVIAWIREQPALKEVPVIALTASVMPAHRGRIEESGFNGFIAKPLSSVREFVLKVREHLGRS